MGWAESAPAEAEEAAEGGRLLLGVTHGLALVACVIGLVAPALAGSALLRGGYGEQLLSGVNERDALAGMKMLANQLSASAGGSYAIDLAVYASRETILDDFERRRIDIAGVAPEDYLFLTSRVKLVPAFAPAPEQYVLLVRSDSGVTSLSQLRGKQLSVLTSGRGTSPRMWLDVLLLRGGLPRGEQFFGRLGSAAEAGRAVLQVFFRQSDACLVPRGAFSLAAEMNPQVGRQVRALATSSAMLPWLVCYREGADRKTVDAMVGGALRLHTSTKGKQILTLIREERLGLVREADLGSVKALLEEYARLTRQPARAAR